MADKEEINKKCTETGTTLKRSKRYYRNGKYFLNKNAFKIWIKKQLEEQKKKDEEAAAAKKEAEDAKQEVKEPESKPEATSEEAK